MYVFMYVSLSYFLAGVYYGDRKLLHCSVFKYDRVLWVVNIYPKQPPQTSCLGHFSSYISNSKMFESVSVSEIKSVPKIMNSKKY